MTINYQLVQDASDNINANYPISGQDNNTQGFRDNFSNTKAGLDAAATALETLDSTTVKKEESNNFGNTGIIKNALLSTPKSSSAYAQLGGGNGNIIALADRDYLRIEVTASVTGIVFSGWGTDTTDPQEIAFGQKFRKVRLEFWTTGSAKNIKFSNTNGGDANYNKIKYNDLLVFDPLGTGLEITEDSVIIDAWVSDYKANRSPSGKAIYLQYIGTFVEAQ